MTERDTLQKLIDEGAVATTLRRGSGARHAIAALQTLLHWLGFDRKLKWQKYGADGDYGGATVAAVAEFAKRNGSTGNGQRLNKALAEKLTMSKRTGPSGITREAVPIASASLPCRHF
jgi:peptidoglycan hydrolase-like protein with peptidoglycan-binding domain